MVRGVGVCVCVWIAVLGSAQAEVASHQVTALPGWSEYGRSLASRLFSGYMDLEGGRHLHYVFVESEGDPQADPVVLWLNGGPGASSLFGMLTENGPYYTNDNSFIFNDTEVPRLFYNPHGWQKVADMLYLEAPAGVGFSYCDGDDGPVDSCPLWNDTNTAQDNHEFLQAWFKAYPEYQDQEFYITGESYAGVYIPTLVQEILDDPTYIPLKGIAIGDGCNGLNSFGGCGLDSMDIFVRFMYGHGQFSTPLYNQILDTCGVEELHFGNYSKNANCNALLDKMYAQVGGFNGYNLYDVCTFQHDERRKLFEGDRLADAFPNGRLDHSRAYAYARARAGNQGTVSEAPKFKKESGGDYFCGASTAMQVYLNLDQVKTALHVIDVEWIEYDGWGRYTSTAENLVPLYPTFLEQGLKVLIYYGDSDPAVPYLGGEAWTSSLYTVAQDWRPWSTDGGEMMAGYVQTYAAPSSFWFATVRGAGHMVPTAKPREALVLLSSFLNGEDLPYYV